MSADIRLTEYGPMSSSLKCSSLSELCVDKIGVQTGPFGSQLHKEDYVEVGTPIITVEHLGDNRIVHVDTPFVSDEDKARLSKYHLAEGDIVFSRVGSVDRRALVRKEEDGWLFSGRCLRVRVDKTKIDPVYLSYFFGLEGFKNYIRNIAVGATMPSINTKILSDVPIYYPECLEEQRKIANIFYTSDEKIELNRQTSQTLEHIAQAIFKSWFVDFEPTRAKIAAKQIGRARQDGERSSALREALLAEGRWPETIAGAIAEGDPDRAAMAAISGKSLDELDQLSPEQQEQLRTTAALFPDALVDSELGEIPESWILGELRNIADFAVERVDASELTLETYISTENMLEGKKGVTTASSLPTVKTVPSFKPGQILISNIRPYFMKIWLARFAGGRSNDVLGIEAKETESTDYLYNLLYQDVFFNFMMTTSKGAKMPRGDKEAIMGWICVQPGLEVKQMYSKVIGHFYEIIDEKNKQNESLANLRDTLLPKLLSGTLENSIAA